MKSKDQIKKLFVKGSKPTQENFEDLINSCVHSVNGNIPDANGNVELPLSNTNDVYGGKFEWQYNASTNSLDLVVLQ